MHPTPVAANCGVVGVVPSRFLIVLQDEASTRASCMKGRQSPAMPFFAAPDLLAQLQSRLGLFARTASISVGMVSKGQRPPGIAESSV